MNARDAANKAIEELPEGEVKDYLRADRAEVIDMLLTEYNEEKTLQTEYYAGERAGLQKGLHMLYDLVASGELSVTTAFKKAAEYGIADEAEFRARAAEHGVQLPD